MTTTSPIDSTHDEHAASASAAVVAIAPSALQRKAFEAIRPEIDAVDPERYEPINIDIPGSVITVLGRVENIMSFRERASALTEFDIGAFDNLGNYALGTGHAHTHYLAASAPAEPVQPLVDELLKIKDVMLVDVTALTKRNLLDPDRLKQLQGTNGFKNLAYDVLLLCVLLREHWGDVSARTGAQIAEVDHAEDVANRLVAALGKREANASAVPQASGTRQAAFTLLVHAYDEVRRALTFLRWKEDDVESIAPSLYAGRGTRRRPDEEVPAPAPVTPAPGGVTPSPAPAPSVPVAPTNGTRPPVVPSLAGLPGDTPFSR